MVYAQGSDHRPLVKSLEGQNTGWCTVGESTAKLQLAKGDFHVYYSLDDKGNPTIPRIAIRMEGNELAELRGVATDQNLDPQINQSNVVSEKMKEFGSKADMFRKKDHDMKMLNQIEVKHKNRIALNKEEIKFLYEVDSKIQGFGFGKDPRIEEIKQQRDIKDDFVIVYDHKYTRDEISLSREEALSGKAKIHVGNLDLSDLTTVTGLKLPDIIDGNLNLSRLISAEGLKLPIIIKGNLSMDSLTSAKGIIFPNSLHSLTLSSLTSPAGLKLPEIINGNLDLNSLVSVEGLKLPDTLGGLLLSSLTTEVGLKLPETIKGFLDLRSLTSAKSLKRPSGVEIYQGSRDIQK